MAAKPNPFDKKKKKAAGKPMPAAAKKKGAKASDAKAPMMDWAKAGA